MKGTNFPFIQKADLTSESPIDINAGDGEVTTNGGRFDNGHAVV
jgi:hypothetical protein